MPEGALLLGFVSLQRIAEILWARRNEACLLARGGIEFGSAHYPFMVAMHGSWLAGLWLLAADHPIDRGILVLLVLLQLGRLWVLATLGRRWTTRVVVVKGEALVRSGPYRLLRHPNYWIVVAEIAAVPLALGLPLYAAIFSVLNAVLLRERIRVENAALAWISF